MASWLAAPITGPDAQRAAEAELRKSEYHRDDPNLTDRIVRWIGHRLDFVLSGNLGGSATLVVAILIGAAVVLAVRRASTQRSLTRAKRARHDSLQPEPGVDHAALAQRYTESGDYAQALREWLRDAAATVERRGVLVNRPGRTADEFAREAGALLPAAGASLASAVASFDLVFYADLPATAEHAAAGKLAAERARTSPIARGRVPAQGQYAAPR